MTSKHTPGPWQTSVEQDVTGYPCFFIHGFSGPEKYDKPVHEANARLIAAAPDLLEALKSALNALSACSNLRATDLAQEAFDAHVANGVERHRLEWFVDNSQEIASAEAAIAKAEGRQ